MTIKIALLGDQSDEVIAHRAIPPALQLAARQLSVECSSEWIHTTKINQSNLSEYSGIRCVPASPYADPLQMIEAIQYARESKLPMLGTCGGYQHAVMEFAQNVLGHSDAGNTEDNSDTKMPLINAMFCSLREKPGQIRFKNPSRLYSIYQKELIEEQYNCGFGVNIEYLHLFDDSDMVFTGFDNDSDPRAFELNNHPFFIGTAYQPERSALKQENHPLITGFVKAANEHPLAKNQTHQAAQTSI